ncbi:MAG: heme exporter protein CcmD [Gammaproteobacteria bacterium]|nr:heme exporter protein CcmD [Gammaproteobacteria bacterium]CAJ2377043.1 MAG: Heme exporter protein D [Arenicellales bacterium IbO2]MDA7968722.1 heme exporter protein CcmD [Gammaproteobacteria bacterium]MDA7970937.1 heme exporter protein CcmD [Gammaproteobacteria bacterium]MDA7972535.1 heme exporter protein CcmD [Gammaproteobacteria bacterium]
MAEFAHMGGYAFYVWCSYGLVAALLAHGFCAPLLRRKKLLAKLAAESGEK